ncbi:PaaX family transcriptional regulator [Rhizobium sp. R72]|uniref:PaaX family transcriptional regulator C-terminal domain-containing protein n=1 Tax=unclassified Rhizobium TaxID=2613769 RepID=UPI000B52A527|nr:MULTISPECIES: PaaX family transcriptional regulator C-terminal domain-containing protein [unclassified Rhizobium]OWV97412.1 PaaX family transcriptional regulator [Rhizobium sp. R72]OWV97751.1 PaaX family transcriptional regulator [Rhizobium sp. R711]
MTAATNRADAGASELIRRILAESPLKAAGFIVTIYGDVVEPRGGIAWIGNLIETCADVGISETLVRTAVSRLVAAGQLCGERQGRRSYYRLSRSAGSEFAAAARVLFGTPEEGSWQFVHVFGPSVEEAMQTLKRKGHARIAYRLAVGPERRSAEAIPGLVFRADAPLDHDALQAFALENWDLAAHARAYETFLEQFGSMSDPAEAVGISPATALIIRLLLVHRFRTVHLHDPRLPSAALPGDWPGKAARQLFSQVYRRFSPAADAFIARTFLTASGPLPASTPTTNRRLETLTSEAG